MEKGDPGKPKEEEGQDKEKDLTLRKLDKYVRGTGSFIEAITKALHLTSPKDDAND
ncbi:MAG: hypothetical protein WC640_02120 [Candidatus Paceibacterota bacterium]|jgi:hypothetical protein